MPTPPKKVDDKHLNKPCSKQPTPAATDTKSKGCGGCCKGGRK